MLMQLEVSEHFLIFLFNQTKTSYDTVLSFLFIVLLFLGFKTEALMCSKIDL